MFISGVNDYAARYVCNHKNLATFRTYLWLHAQNLPQETLFFNYCSCFVKVPPSAFGGRSAEMPPTPSFHLRREMAKNI